MSLKGIAYLKTVFFPYLCFDLFSLNTISLNFYHLARSWEMWIAKSDESNNSNKKTKRASKMHEEKSIMPLMII